MSQAHSTEISWTQYQQMTEKQLKQSNRLIAKLVKNPNSKQRQIWIDKIIELGDYDLDDIDYLIKFYSKG